MTSLNQDSKLTASDWILEAESGKRPFASLYESFHRGDFTPTNILEAYRVRDSPRFIVAVNKFTSGTLFKAQTETFNDFIEGRNRYSDRETVSLFYSVQDSAMQKHKGIIHFIQSRIQTKILGDKEKEDMGAIEKLRNAWTQANQLNGWTWRNV